MLSPSTEGDIRSLMDSFLQPNAMFYASSVGEADVGHSVHCVPCLLGSNNKPFINAVILTNKLLQLDPRRLPLHQVVREALSAGVTLSGQRRGAGWTFQCAKLSCGTSDLKDGVGGVEV